MAPTSARGLVEVQFGKGREKRYHGSVWRLGPLALTRTDGQLTDAGRAFQELRPTESLSHIDRDTESVAGSQVRVQTTRAVSASSAAWSMAR